MRPGRNDEYFVNSSSYYHWPPIWVGNSPVSDGEVDARKLAETIYRKILDSGVEMKVYRDGMFAFRFSDWPPGRYPSLSERMSTAFDAAEMRAQRIRLFNAHLACLYTVLWRRQDSTLKRMIVSPDEMISMKLIDDNSEHNINDERFDSMLDARNPASVKHWSPPLEVDWRFSRGVVEKETVEESVALLDQVLRYRDEEALVLTALYARAAKHHEERNHDICLITAWAVVERLLNRLWGPTKEGCKTPKARKMIKVLSATDQLSPRLCEELSIVREARDGWMHRLEPVTKQNSGRAIRAAEAMLGRCLDLKFAVPLEPGQRYEGGTV